MTDINLSDLSVEQLESLKRDVDNTMERKHNDELMAVREKLDDLIDNSPFTLEEILGARAMRKPIAPKYRNPDDASQTWTGRGRKPLWVIERLDNDGSLAAMAI